MQLEEMRMTRKVGDEDPALEASLAEAKDKFEGLVVAVDRDLRTEWQLWDAGNESARQAAQKRMVALLDRRRYLSNLVRDVTETLGA
jgi:molecular chaperone HscB